MLIKIFMKSVCIFAPNYDSFMESYINNIYVSLSSKHNWKVVVYGVDSGARFSSSGGVKSIVDRDLDYLYKNNDPRIYENFLNFVDESNFEKIFIPRLTHPEYLYSELRIRSINVEIIFSIFSYELLSKSRARRELLIDLICQSCISQVLVHSIMGKYLGFPFDYRASEVTKKLMFISEPIYESKEEYEYSGSRCMRNIVPTVLYFGNMFYGKGVDLLLAASTLVKKEMLITIAGDFSRNNFKIPNFPENDKVRIINKFIDRAQMIELFRGCDAVVLPYRKTYEHGTSGVFVQSMLAGKPILVPNISPFSSTVELYSCGSVFRAEDIVDLARGLDEIVGITQERVKEGTSNYRDDLISWDELATIIAD
jgi:glycosyltransferase involved in cell wall biosynthesis